MSSYIGLHPVSQEAYKKAAMTASVVVLLRYPEVATHSPLTITLPKAGCRSDIRLGQGLYSFPDVLSRAQRIFFFGTFVQATDNVLKIRYITKGF